MNVNLGIFTSYEDGFLEFDERVGFRPTKKEIDIDNYLNDPIMFYLVTAYHNMRISRIENESNNPAINQIISILDSDSHEQYSMEDMFIKSYAHMFKTNQFINEFLSSIYGVLADVGYGCWIRFSIELYLKQGHGRKKALKYIKMAMDNGDKEYTIFYERYKYMLENEKVFQFHFWANKYIDSYIEEDFKSAFYDHTMMYLNLGKDILSCTPNQFNINLAIVFYRLDKINESIRYFEQYFGI